MTATLPVPDRSALAGVGKARSDTVANLRSTSIEGLRSRARCCQAPCDHLAHPNRETERPMTPNGDDE